MTENTINVEMNGYANVADLSVQCLGVLPQSISGHSPTALIKVVYPNEDYEEIFMDLVTRQNHVSHGYKLQLNNVSIATTYIPWRKMFTGSAVLKVDKEEAIVDEIKEESYKTDPPMSPIYLLPNGKLVFSDGKVLDGKLLSQAEQTTQPDSLTKLSNSTIVKGDTSSPLLTNSSLTNVNSNLLTNGSTNSNLLTNGSTNSNLLTNGSTNSNLLTNGSTNSNIGGVLLFALGFVAALGIIGLIKRQ